MLLVRAALLEFLVCAHVLGAAVLFRRLFPRESPWLAFFLPTLGLMFVLNFVEHFNPLPSLGWLLPFTLGGSLYCLFRFTPYHEGLRFPALLFVAAFSYIFYIRGLHCEIPIWTEGLADLARVLDFCLGDKLPPTDSWLPPYDHGGYYTFQHYGASILKRLLSLDIGTGYNVSFTFLNAFIALMAAAAATSLTGKNWIGAAVLVAVVASFNGSAILMAFFNPSGVDGLLYYDLNHGWADKHHNPLWHLLDGDPFKQRTRLFVPGSTIYLPEFHANMSGHFLTLFSILAGVEACRERRSNWPWIILLVAPVMAIIASTWFLPVILFLCASGLVVALIYRRPESPFFVAAVTIAAIALIWPSVSRLTGLAMPQTTHWTLPEERTYLWLFVEQWWPVYLPWLMLGFVWPRLNLAARWLYIAIPCLLLIFEYVTIAEREGTLEKIWSALYGAGLVSFLALALAQPLWPYRIFTGVMVISSLAVLHFWWVESHRGVDYEHSFFRLQGDMILNGDPQKVRILKNLERLHAATILPGRPTWAYSQTPAAATFSENRCFIGWEYPEHLAGNGDEPAFRNGLSTQFYDGKMPFPLAFLSSYNIAAVVIWPDDEIPDAMVTQLQTQLASGYYYVDCRGDKPRNGGVFFRLPHELK